MARYQVPSVQEQVSPNLIPMVDIMFLLLLFFMLGADMGQREQAELRVPEADQVKEEKKEKVEGEVRTTINIHHPVDIVCPLNDSGKLCRDMSHWMIQIRGRDYTLDNVKVQLKAEADEALEDTVDPVAKVKLSKRKAIIRADRFAPYGHVQKLIEILGSVGIYKVEVGAAKPAPDK